MLPQLMTATALAPLDRIIVPETHLEKSPFLAEPTFDSRAFPHRRWPIQSSRCDIQTWDLRIFGAVADELRFTWKDLSKLPEANAKFDTSVTSFTAGPRHWQGVDAWSILSLAGVRSDAEWLIVHCDGGYSHCLEVDRFFEGPSLLAHGVDGKPLTSREGGPLRIILPHFPTWQSAKWVRGLELATRPLG